MSSADPAPIAARAAAVKAALIEQGLLSAELHDHIVHLGAEEWQPANGAAVVARAWQDPAFKARLLDSATAACAELGYRGAQGEYIVAL